MKHLLFVASLVASPALGQSFADPAALDRSVAEFTGAPLGEPGGAAAPIDRRMRLAPCSAPVALSWYGARRDTVTVRCPDVAGWRIFVPLLVAPGANAAVGAAQQPNAVVRGEEVKISVSGEGFSLSQTAEALEAGPMGAWIRVRTVSASQGFRAKIVRPGLVMLSVGDDLP